MPELGSVKSGALVAAATTAGGDVLNLLNPEGVDLFITALILDITTPATGAATADAGVAATGTSDDTLMDGVDVGTAAIVANAIKHAGTNGMSQVKWPADEYLTITPSATVVGLVGRYYVEYRRAYSAGADA